MLLETTALVLALLHSAASQKVSITQLPVYASQRPCAQRCFAYNTNAGPERVANEIGCDSDVPQNECFCRSDLQADADAFLQTCVDRGCDQNSKDTNSAVSIYDAYCTSAGYMRDVLATPASGTDDFPSVATVTVTATVKVSSAQRRFASRFADSSTTPSTLPPIPPSLSTVTSQGSSRTSPASSPKASNSAKDPSVSTSSQEDPTPEPTDPTSGGSNSSSSGGGNSLGIGDIIGIVVGIAGFIATAIGTWFTYKSILRKKKRISDQLGENPVLRIEEIRFRLAKRSFEKTKNPLETRENSSGDLSEFIARSFDEPQVSLA
ncbi:hypothetical protein F5B22DRAFT_651491 [Xylaria bambusicola]|uniref:uncharacterized protein n=1 Tax=Xylaria bambusicola TaxID=326684 RepID=UPI00200754B4|nr:uncharacterized protein F5B22DRAFT_651491 [Xylaria bambusicola]KAI0505693.1 hypothetical protein F5B22DRAFT_651491 [Xylaria bambusicola]